MLHCLRQGEPETGPSSHPLRFHPNLPLIQLHNPPAEAPMPTMGKERSALTLSTAGGEGVSLGTAWTCFFCLRSGFVGFFMIQIRLIPSHGRPPNSTSRF